VPHGPGRPFGETRRVPSLWHEDGAEAAGVGGLPAGGDASAGAAHAGAAGAADVSGGAPGDWETGFEVSDRA
jgi:hypothetical protein